MPNIGEKILCPSHNDTRPSFSIFQHYSGRLAGKCFACGYFAFLDGDTSVVSRPRNFRRTRFGNYDEPEEPVPVPERMDSTLNAIREQAESPDGRMMDAAARRGISPDVLRRHNVAFFDEIRFYNPKSDAVFSRYYETWLIPLTDAANRPLAVKIHRERPIGKQGKSAFLEVGRGRHCFETLWPPPETYPIEEPLILCPGELKALACVGAGFNATSLTRGEESNWTQEQVQRLKNRRIVLLFDDDPAGQRLRDRTVRMLRCRCAELRCVTFGRTDSGKIDANDVARDHGADGLRNRLNFLIGLAPNMARKPFDLAHHRSDLGRIMREAVNDPDGGIWCIASIVGAGKSWTIADVINASDKKFVIFCHSHKLAKEYEAKIPGALRLVSPRIMTKEADDPACDDDDGMIECPSVDRINDIQARGYSYTRICKNCPLSGECPSFQRRMRAEDARVIILQHSHLRIGQQAYTKDRIRVIDESAVQHLQWRHEFELGDLHDFQQLVTLFHRANPEADPSPVARIIARVREIKPGESFTFSSPTFRMSEAAIRCWQRWIASDGPALGRNLMPGFIDVAEEGAWIRRDGDTFYSVRSAIPDDKQPIIILDATQEPEVYGKIFDRPVRLWPDEDLPDPVSRVIQFVDGRYPASSLIVGQHNGGKKADYGKPTPTADRIMDNIERIVRRVGIPWQDVGIVTLKQLLVHCRQRFAEIPASQFLNYGGLKGLNSMERCRLVCLVGCQGISHVELAKSVGTIGKINESDAKLLEMAGERAGFEPLTDEYEVRAKRFADARFNAAWRLLVTSEIVQGIGRARPYAPRDEQQVVLVFCSEPLPMPVSRAMTQDELLQELGILTATDKINMRAKLAMMELAARHRRFCYETLAIQLGVSRKTLNARRWQDAIREAASGLGLEAEKAFGGELVWWSPVEPGWRYAGEDRLRELLKAGA